MMKANECWVSGIKPLGYKLHISTTTARGEIEFSDYREAIAMQRAIRGGSLAASLATCEARMQSDQANAEFWRRLAGSLRKARAMI